MGNVLVLKPWGAWGTLSLKALGLAVVAFECPDVFVDCSYVVVGLLFLEVYGFAFGGFDAFVFELAVESDFVESLLFFEGFLLGFFACLCFDVPCLTGFDVWFVFHELCVFCESFEGDDSDDAEDDYRYHIPRWLGMAVWAAWRAVRAMRRIWGIVCGASSASSWIDSFILV